MLIVNKISPEMLILLSDYNCAGLNISAINIYFSCQFDTVVGLCTERYSKMG